MTIKAKQNQVNAKRVLLINTGGTIASLDSAQGKRPGLNAQELLSILSPQQRASIGKNTDIFTKNLFGSGMDSSEMTPYHVREIAQAIKNEYNSYDSFIVTHGTDTLAETASLLSFMIQQNKKSIILTGSQKTPSEKDSDAPFNLYCALEEAKKDVGGVVVSFGEHTFAGYTIKKVHTKELVAFKGKKPQKVTQDEAIFSPQYSQRVDTLYITTSTKPKIIDHYFKHNDALVVQVFGMGGTNNNISQKLIEWANKGKKIIAKTKCAEGITDLTEYEVGLRLSQEGILSALELTVEAAQAKLQWLLGSSHIQQSFKNIWYTNFIGEMPPSTVSKYLNKEQQKTLQLITEPYSKIKEKYLYNSQKLEVV